MSLAKAVTVIAATLCPTLAFAQVPTAPAPATDERRLTPEQVEAVLAEAAAKRTAAEKHAPVEEVLADDSDLLPAPQLHGEVGVSVGTGGYREIYGTGIYPLGTDGSAAFAVDFVDWGNRRYRY